MAILKSRLEESWGNHDHIVEEISKVGKFNSHGVDDNYDEDDFEVDDIDRKMFKKDDDYEDDEDDKIVDEEFNLSQSNGSGNSSGGKKDSDFLKELMKPPIRTKIHHQPAGKPLQ